MSAPVHVCGWCDGAGSVFGLTGQQDADGCPVRDATACDICGGSGQVTR